MIEIEKVKVQYNHHVYLQPVATDQVRRTQLSGNKDAAIRRTAFFECPKNSRGVPFWCVVLVATKWVALLRAQANGQHMYNCGGEPGSLHPLPDWRGALR